MSAHSQQDSTDPTADELSDLVTEFVQAFEDRDLEKALTYVADDIEYDNVPMGKVHGPDGIRERLSQGLTKTADQIEWIVYRQAAQGRFVFNERLDRFRVGETWLEVPVTGVFEFRGRQIVLWRDYFDLQTFVDQFEALSA